jgi:hypothetical protein
MDKNNEIIKKRRIVFPLLIKNSVFLINELIFKARQSRVGKKGFYFLFLYFKAGHELDRLIITDIVEVA